MPKNRASQPIGYRLSLVVVMAVFIGILASVSFFLFNDFRQTVAAERMRLESSAAAFAAAASGSVAQSDRRGALEVLRGIRDLSHVTYAKVRDKNGSVLAEMGSATMLVGRDGALDDKNALSMFFAESLTVEAEIRRGGLVIGVVQLQAEIGWLRERYLDSLSISLLFGLALMLITSIGARMRIARIINPLTVLADEFADIGKRSDLTKRLQTDSDDEVGVLIGAFNDMFSRIDERDQQLKRHRDTLEETVEIRTAEMRSARDDAERANAAKSDFLATMSHEIRTPMNGMMVMAEMLSAAPLSEKHRRYTEIISRSGQGLLNIINDILDFSKIEAGRLELEEIPFSMDTLVEDVASLFSERAREKNLAIATCIAPDVPAKLIGDPTRISQVLTNLVNNALKFTEHGGVTIEVNRTAASVPEGHARLEVHIRDTGIGIARDKIGAIFERFTQADQTITRKFGGTGLGLSISRKLIDAMGGGIVVTSEPGAGSDFCFSVSLPVVEEAGREMLSGAAILVLDDDPVTAAAAEEALLARGATVVRTAGAGPAPRLVLARAAALSQLGDGEAPVILMRPFSSSSAHPAGLEVAGEIQLPLRRAELDQLARSLRTGDFSTMREASDARNRTIELPDFSGLKVLAVDDTAVNREVLNEALTSFGIAADLAESGEEAVEMAAAQEYDIIFMDCSMPGMDGFTATGAIRAFEADSGRVAATVVALTAHVAGDEALRWHEAGMDAYVAKPFTLPQLVSVIEPVATRRGGGQPAPVRPPAAAVPAIEELPDAWKTAPLVSPETLDMFAAISGANGSSMAGKIFGLFRAHAPKGFHDLLDGLDGDMADGARLAHALKSMCNSAGAERAALLCQAIEEAFKAGMRPDRERLAALETAIDETIDAMGASPAPVAKAARA